MAGFTLPEQLPGQLVLLINSSEFDSQELSRQLQQQVTEPLIQLWEEIATSESSTRLLVVADCPQPSATSCALTGLGGFIKSLRLEQPDLLCKLVVTDESDHSNLFRTITDESDPDSYGEAEVYYRNGTRLVKRYRQTSLPQTDRHTLKAQGVYLITGGLGGLGLLVGKLLAERYRARLILTGRSPLTPERETQLTPLRDAGAEVSYKTVDITDHQQVMQLINEIKTDYGEINGIFHSAGMLDDALLINKDADRIHTVLAPKLSGTINLDEATADEPLDFMVLFSSITGLIGNRGQCDYAWGNAFMDAFAHRRIALTREGRRRGQTLSINWPLWES
ncbi:MAG: SDR family NAD(P)-dependent oxidoreductase, partial [bacterium]|nr:SDR family NAD(P)-dependent oxidoreductase [bacterium]